MASTENVQLVRPAEISEWEIKQARRLIELSQQEPLPSLLAEQDLMSCLYYPLRQVPLPQFQFEMLLWDSDKLNLFSGTENAEVSQIKIKNGTLLNPEILYKRADDFTVLALVYSLESQMAAVFTNEISQTSWEIVGVFSTHNLAKLISLNHRYLHTYDTFEKAYGSARKQSNLKDANEKEEDNSYWNRYDNELDSNEPESGKAPQTDEEYWQMYDNVSDEESSGLSDKATQIIQTPANCNLATRMILSLIPLYHDCGLEDKKRIGGAIRDSVLPDDRVVNALAMSHQIAQKHTRRTIALIQEQLGQTAYEQAIDEALQIIERS